MTNQSEIDKRAEIREGIAIWVYNYEMSGKGTMWALWVDASSDIKYHYRSCANEMMRLMDEQGVVMQVKCPNCSWSQFVDVVVGMTPCCCCNSIGYTTIPLIEEEKKNDQSI